MTFGLYRTLSIKPKCRDTFCLLVCAISFASVFWGLLKCTCRRMHQTREDDIDLAVLRMSRAKKACLIVVIDACKHTTHHLTGRPALCTHQIPPSRENLTSSPSRSLTAHRTPLSSTRTRPACWPSFADSQPLNEQLWRRTAHLERSIKSIASSFLSSFVRRAQQLRSTHFSISAPARKSKLPAAAAVKEANWKG